MALLALARPELYTEHRRLGRNPEQYESWLADVLVASLLRDGSTAA